MAKKGEKAMSRKKFKPDTQVAPPPCKFAIGQRVKPSEEGRKMGWHKPGVVTLCLQYAVRVKVDGEEEAGYSVDYWEAE